VQLDVRDAAVFVIAYAAEDTATQRELLGGHITLQVLTDWGGRPGRTMAVTVIETIRSTTDRPSRSGAPTHDGDH
jgi:hypothetical protein